MFIYDIDPILNVQVKVMHISIGNFSQIVTDGVKYCYSHQIESRVRPFNYHTPYDMEL